jgi:hypothetical protein
MAIVLVSPSVLTGANLYASISAGVYDITKRPDLIQETILAIRKAIMKFHMAELWKNDIVQVYPLVTVGVGDTYSYRYSLTLSDAVVFPLFRRVAFIKEYNATPLGYELDFKELDMASLLDDYQLEKVDYWTQAGMGATIRSSKALTQLRVGYYKYPNVIPTTFESWIASQFPDAIIEEAIGSIFSSIGKMDEARDYKSRFLENLHMLQITQIV